MACACRRCDLREQNEQQKVGIQSPNHLPHLTWVVIWSVISDGATSRSRQPEPHGHLQRLVTWHREPAEAPSCHPSRWLLQPQAAAQRQEENLLYAHCLRLRLQIALKAKKKWCMYPDLLGRHGGQPPKRLPPEPYFTPPGVKSHFLAHPPFVSAGAQRHRFGWVPALPAGRLNNVKPMDVQEAHRATLWRI